MPLPQRLKNFVKRQLAKAKPKRPAKSRHQGEAPHKLADVVEHYDKHAAVYREVFKDVFQTSRPTDLNELLAYEMASMKLEDGYRVLDAGCGVCGPSIWFAKNKNVTIDAVTISPNQKPTAETAIAAAGLSGRVHVHVADYHKLEDIFPVNTFDTVFYLESLCHAVSFQRTLASAAKVLKPGGHLYIKDYFERDFSHDPAKQARAQEFLRKCYAEYALTTVLRTEMVEMLTKLGFEIEMIEPFPFVGDKEDLSFFVEFEQKAGLKWREGLDFWLPECLEVRARKR